MSFSIHEEMMVIEPLSVSFVYFVFLQLCVCTCIGTCTVRGLFSCRNVVGSLNCAVNCDLCVQVFVT